VIAGEVSKGVSCRLDGLEDRYELFRCHRIKNRVDASPKGLNPTAAIGQIRQLLTKRIL